MKHSLKGATALLLTLGLLSGCSAGSQVSYSPGPAAVVFEASWTDSLSGRRFFLPGLSCELVGEKPANRLWAATHERSPLVLGPLEPGKYRLKVRGQDLPELSWDVLLAKARTARIQVDFSDWVRQYGDTRSELADAGRTALRYSLYALIIPPALALMAGYGWAEANTPQRNNY